MLELLQMRAAIVYDRVNKWGGAERVLLTLHEMFPKAPLYTSVYNKKTAKWAEVFPEVKTSFLQNIPYAKSNHEFLASLMPLAFESFDFSKFDMVISVTSEAAKGVITKPNTLHICYCLTPTRYLWSHYDLYFERKQFLRKFSKPMISYLKTWDKKASKRPDIIIAISTEVKKRIKKYYSRDSKIVHPPVWFSTSVKREKYKPKIYCLVVSRLVHYKKVDLAISAFNELGLPLVVAGVGRDEKRLRNMASKNITFTGFLSEEELVEYYRNCSGLVFPQEEDFGLTAVEAQLLGVPVIAFRGGGALDTVIEGETGLFFDKHDVCELKKAVKRFKKTKFKKNAIIKNAKRFSKDRFKKEFHEIIANAKRRI